MIGCLDVQIPFEALLPAEVRRMVAPDSHLDVAGPQATTYSSQPREPQTVALDERAPSLTLSEEAAPPLGGNNSFRLRIGRQVMA